MNRVETIQLFLQCEAARKNALDNSQSEEEAHEAAKAVWNSWAEALLEEKRKLEETGGWRVKQALDAGGEEEGKSQETADWLKRASVDFSGIRFSVYNGDTEEANRGTDRDAGEIQQLFSFGSQINFTEFVFPRNITFENSVFYNVASFSQCVFHHDGEFSGAVFHEAGVFDESVFKGYAEFSGIEFRNDAGFHNVAFEYKARFSSAVFSGSSCFNQAVYADYAGFDTARFQGKSSFYKAVFSDIANFQGAQFSLHADFVHASFSVGAVFSGARFLGDAGFINARFNGDVSFGETQFEGAVNFANVIFSDIADYHGSFFLRDVTFHKGGFREAARFHGSCFAGNASFIEVSFSEAAFFREAQFFQSAGFNSAAFEGYADFHEAVFSDTVSFSGINANRAFVLSGSLFKTNVPSFNQANFKEAPLLSNSRLPIPGFWSSIFRFPPASLVAKFRSLRRLATEGHDHERERLFFKGEMRAKRGTEEKFYQARWWLSVIYDAVSDYGRSVMRPLLLWLLLIPAFGWFYVAAATVVRVCEAYVGNGIYLSLQNALVFMAANRRREIGEAYQCFFGDGKLPEWIGVIGLGHTLFSVVLLFLVLLGLRNMFRIK